MGLIECSSSVRAIILAHYIANRRGYLDTFLLSKSNKTDQQTRNRPAGRVPDF